MLCLTMGKIHILIADLRKCSVLLHQIFDPILHANCVFFLKKGPSLLFLFPFSFLFPLFFCDLGLLEDLITVCTLSNIQQLNRYTGAPNITQRHLI